MKEVRFKRLDRTQTDLPIKRGPCGTWTYEYVRNGTTTLFAALNPSLHWSSQKPHLLPDDAPHGANAAVGVFHLRVGSLNPG
jgi:hypothetical protein